MPPAAPPSDLASLVRALHRIGAVQFGQFTLKDGRSSPFYIDLRTLIADPSVLRQAAHLMLEAVRSVPYDRIAGLPYAGLPIGVAMALEAGVPLLYPRKEAKDYGTRRQIEGIYHAGERVLVVDDVITSGGAKIEGVRPLRDAGLVVEHVVVLVDRSAQGDAVLQQHGLTLHRVLRVQQLFELLRAAELITAAQARQAAEFLAAPPA